MRPAGLKSVYNALQPYILYNNRDVVYEIVESFEQGYAPVQAEHVYFRRQCHQAGSLAKMSEK